MMDSARGAQRHGPASDPPVVLAFTRVYVYRFTKPTSRAAPLLFNTSTYPLTFHAYLHYSRIAIFQFKNATKYYIRARYAGFIITASLSQSASLLRK
jgi:hypothetical protein